MPKRAAGEQGFRLGPGESGIANQAEFDGIHAAHSKPVVATPEVMNTRKIAAPKGARRPPGSPRPGMFSSVDQIGNPFAPQTNGTAPVNGMNGTSSFPAFGQQQNQNSFSSNAPSSAFNFSNPQSSTFGTNNASSNPTQTSGIFGSTNQSQPGQQQADQGLNGAAKAFSFTFGAGAASDNTAKSNSTFNFGGSTGNNPFAGLSQKTSSASSGGLFSPQKPASNSFPPSQVPVASGFGSNSANSAQGNSFGAFGNGVQSNAFGAPGGSTSEQGKGLFQQQGNNLFQQPQQQNNNLFQQTQQDGANPFQSKNLFQQQETSQTNNFFSQSQNEGSKQSPQETKSSPSDSMQMSPPTSPTRQNANQRSIFGVMTNGDENSQTPKPNIFGNLQQPSQSSFSPLSAQEQTAVPSQPAQSIFAGFGKTNSQISQPESTVTSTNTQQSLPAFASGMSNKSQSPSKLDGSADERPSAGSSDQTSSSAPKFNPPSFGSGPFANPFANKEAAKTTNGAAGLPKFDAPSYKSGPFADPFANKQAVKTSEGAAELPKFKAPSFNSGPFSNPFPKAATTTHPSSSTPQFGSQSSDSQPSTNIFGMSPAVEESRAPAPSVGEGNLFSSFKGQTSTAPTPGKSIAPPAPSFFSKSKADSEQLGSSTPSTFSKESAPSSAGTPTSAETTDTSPKFNSGINKSQSNTSSNSFGASTPVAKPFEGFQPTKSIDSSKSTLATPSAPPSFSSGKPSGGSMDTDMKSIVGSLTDKQKQAYEAQRALMSLNQGFKNMVAKMDITMDQSDLMRAYLSAADKIKSKSTSDAKRKQQDDLNTTPKRIRNDDEAPSTRGTQLKSTTSNLFQNIVGNNTTPSKAPSSQFFPQPKTPNSNPESRNMFADASADVPATEPPNPNAGKSLFDRVTPSDKPATEVKKPSFTFFPPTPTSSDDATPGDHTWKNDSPIKFGTSQSQHSQPQFLFAGSTPGSATTSRATSPGAGDGGTTSEAESTTSNTGDDAIKPLDQVDLTAVDDSSEVLYETDKARGSTVDPESKSWVVRGAGPLRILKNKESGLISLLLRTEPSGRVVFNSRLVKGLTYKTAGKNAATLPIVGAGGKFETWHVRFKTQSLADEFVKACEKWKETASS